MNDDPLSVGVCIPPDILSSNMTEKEVTKMTRWSSRGCALLMMAFCSIAPLATAQTQAMASSADSALNVVDPKAGFSSVTRSYSGMDARYVRTGTQTKIAQLRSIAIGEPEAEVEDELGRPRHQVRRR